MLLEKRKTKGMTWQLKELFRKKEDSAQVFFTLFRPNKIWYINITAHCSTS